jgi:hypothetical protein
MLDDIRNHDARPTREELEWMNTDPLKGATRALVMLGLSLMIAMTASYSLAPGEVPAPVVASLDTPAP